jgi:hypothetical protein
MKSTLFFIAAMALLVSCAKQGPTGPEGPAGAAGSTGSTGAQGPTGPSGSNGTANISTIIFSVVSSNWQTITAGADYGVGLADASITVADSDVVDLGISTNSTGPWVALPSTNVVSAGDQISFSYLDGGVNVYYFFTAAPTETLYFKITVIPPAEARKRNNGSIGFGQMQQN